jgi:hypothetical protein
MDLKIASSEDRKKWDSLIAASYGGSVFHTLKYLECMEVHTTTNVLGHQAPGVLYPLVAREGEVIVALFPIFLYSGHGVRIVKSGSYSDDTLYLGPVFMGSDTLEPAKLQVRALRLQMALDAFLRNELKVHAVYLRVSPYYPDARPYLWCGYDAEPAHTYVFSLKEGTDRIWDCINRRVQKKIINAEKRGLCVKMGGLEDAEFICDMLHARNRANSPKAFVLDVVKSHSPDYCSVFFATADGKKLSGVIVLHYGHRAYMWMGYPRSAIEFPGVNEMLMWEVIKWAHSQGYDILENMGGDDISTFQFKRKFNPELKQYFIVNGSSFPFRAYKYLKHLLSPRYDLERYIGSE